jgi:hypothetical protein
MTPARKVVVTTGAPRGKHGALATLVQQQLAAYQAEQDAKWTPVLGERYSKSRQRRESTSSTNIEEFPDP